MEKHKKYRFHLLGLVHLPTSEEYMACAFSQKNMKMCRMLLAMGHEVYLYGAENSTAPCTKLIVTHTLKDIRDTWGEGDNRYEIGYNWHDKQFKHDFNGKKEVVTLKYYENAIKEINRIKREDDFLLVTQGYYQKPIADAVELFLTAESGIGYRGSFAKYGSKEQFDNHRAFESSYIQNFTYGSEHPRESIDGNYYDRVIPNYFDENDFQFSNKKEDYLLFMGRMIFRKGVHTAIKTASALNMRLILAGQLDEVNLSSLPANCEYVGFADPQRRSELMRHARAVLAPSIFLEPFCGVHVEAMLCGTPVLTTNFGAFTDYVIDGVNGYKCDTLNDFVQKARIIGELDPARVRASAQRFTLQAVGKVYQKWFDDLYQVYLSYKNPEVKGWNYIDK